MITAYLSRQSGANKLTQGGAARQPLAALENLQEALSELHLAYDLSRSAVTPTSRALPTSNSGQTAGSSITKFKPGGKDEMKHHHIAEFSAQQQSAEQQADTIQGHPASQRHDVPLVGVHEGATDPAGRPCQHGSAQSSSADDAAEPTTPLQSGNSYRAQNRAEQSAQSMTSTSSSSAEVYLLTSDGASQMPVPAATQTFFGTSPTVYCTPHAMHPSLNEQALSFRSPLLDDEEHWYTPMSTEKSALNADIASSHIANLSQHTLTPGDEVSRADSPSLLYGRGSAFSTDMLGQENEVSSHWLTE